MTVTTNMTVTASMTVTANMTVTARMTVTGFPSWSHLPRVILKLSASFVRQLIFVDVFALHDVAPKRQQFLE